MNTTGYSGTPLVKKLGIKTGVNVWVHNPPLNYLKLLSPLPVEVSVIPGLPLKRVYFVHLFVTRADELKHILISLVDVLDKSGTLWVSWPKKTSNVDTDITEDTLRDYILPTGLVDTKVCAIDETWSGLKFVWRRENR